VAVKAGIILAAAVLLGQGRINADEPASAPASAPSPERISQLVRELGNDDFKTRKAAHEELLRIGVPAKEELTKALNSPDIETKNRVQILLERIARQVEERANQEIASKIEWSCPLDGGPLGGPVTAGNAVAIRNSDGKIYGMSAAGGKRLWVLEGPKEVQDDPVALDKLIYVADASHNVYAFSNATGKQAWKFDPRATATQPATEPADEGPPRPMGGINMVSSSVRSGSAMPVPLKPLFCASSLGAGEGVVVCDDGVNFVALDAASGQKKWACPMESPYGPVAVGGGMVCAADEASVIRAFEAATGRPLWKYEPSDKFTTAVEKISIVQGRVVVAQMESLVALDAKTGKLAWTPELLGEKAPSVDIVNNRRITPGGLADFTLANDMVYVLRRNLSPEIMAFDLQSGKKKLECKVRYEPGDEKKPPGNPANNMQRISTLTTNGSDLKRMLAAFSGSLAVDGEVAYISATEGLTCVNLKDGQVLWRFRSAKPVIGQLVQVGPLLYFSTSGSKAAQARALFEVYTRQPEKEPQDDRPKDDRPAGLHAMKVRDSK
jgi:outer membrane protein assembly factor BamB